MDLLHPIFSNIWAFLLIVLFFGGSIFVHELGHFLAAIWRGLHVDRFSIGFGPKIVSWQRNGVDYRLSWVPLGGYVALPQLADMQAIEGQPSVPAKDLPPIGYTDKMIVSVAGPVFNVLFAFALACIIWWTGLPTNDLQESTTIGYVTPTLTLPDGREVPSPAKKAGLQANDRIVAIDGRRVIDWNEVKTMLVTGIDLTAAGQPSTRLTIERDGQRLTVEVFPERTGDDAKRHIGISPAEPLIVYRTAPNSPGRLAGLQKDDVVVTANGAPIRSSIHLEEIVRTNAGQPIALTYRRGTEVRETAVTPVQVTITTDGEKAPGIGVDFYLPERIIYPGPFDQLKRTFSLMQRILVALVSPRSDIGIGDMSSLPGIVRVLHAASLLDIRLVLWVVVVININLAVFNLLPIPVLDGGHMLFATVAKLMRRPLPPSFVAAAQGTFMIALFSLMIFVGFKDIGRCSRDNRLIDEYRQRYIEPVYPAPEAPPGPEVS